MASVLYNKIPREIKNHNYFLFKKRLKEILINVITYSRMNLWRLIKFIIDITVFFLTQFSIVIILVDIFIMCRYLN